MKILSRDFNGKERALLLFLSLVLVGLVYYYFVDQPVRTALNTAQAEMSAIQTEMDGVDAQIARLSSMQQELEKIRNGESISMMASYNNSKAELALLNDALKNTTKYSITFSDVTREGNQIRRAFSLQFTAANYDSMKQVLAELAISPYRCLIADISCSMSRTGNDSSATQLQVSATATFYETMVGGVADAGLPTDASAAEDASSSSFDNAVVGSEAAAAGQAALGK